MEEPRTYDIVYPVRPGVSNNPQLRYSLRSVARFYPHSRVWIVGHKPPWLRNVKFIPTIQDGNRWTNSTNNIRAACEHEDLSDQFILMNDDFYFMHKVYPLRIYNRGLLSDVIAETQAKHPRGSNYQRGMIEMLKILKVKLGIDDGLSYALHVPMLIDASRWLTAYDELMTYYNGRTNNALHIRTYYGNRWNIGGKTIKDVKVAHTLSTFDRDSPFLSTTADSFLYGQVGRHIRNVLNTKSYYER